MLELWKHSGLYLLDVNDAGQLVVTDEFLRAYLRRPELVPPEEACPFERAVHAALLKNPRAVIEPHEVTAIKDADARENWNLFLAFRAFLRDAPNVETAYLNLHRAAQAAGRLTVPPMFAEQLAHIIVHHLLTALPAEGVQDIPAGLICRAAELFFREQRANVQGEDVMLADLETIEMHADTGGLGNLGRLLVEAQTMPRSVDLSVLERDNAASYFTRDEKHDLVIAMTPGRPGPMALARVMERWIAHMLGVQTRIRPLSAIEDAKWRWHIGLDSTATAILNELYQGESVEPGRMKQLVCLFKLEFVNIAEQRPDIAGKPVYMALAMNEDGVVHMKPHNLLLNLPTAASTS
jgi:hypothetical protein